jgi:hypothetical protein
MIMLAQLITILYMCFIDFFKNTLDYINNRCNFNFTI